MTTRAPFSTDIVREGSLVIFKLHGDLDVDGAQTLRNIFESRVESDERNIVFDLSDVPYINSAGLGAFILFLKSSNLRAGRIFILNAQNKVKNVFQITSLDQRLHFIESLEEASKIVSEDNQPQTT